MQQTTNGKEGILRKGGKLKLRVKKKKKKKAYFLLILVCKSYQIIVDKKKNKTKLSNESVLAAFFCFCISSQNSGPQTALLCNVLLAYILGTKKEKK